MRHRNIELPSNYWESESSGDLMNSLYAIVGDEVIFEPSIDPINTPFSAFEADIKRLRFRVLDRMLGSNRRAVFEGIQAQSEGTGVWWSRYKDWCTQYQHLLHRNDGESDPQLNQMKLFITKEAQQLSKSVLLERNIFPAIRSDLHKALRNNG